MDNKTEKTLKKWVKDNYNPHRCDWTADRSFGNYDDCFDDGTGYQRSWDAYEIGQILGMELEDPDESDDED